MEYRSMSSRNKNRNPTTTSRSRLMLLLGNIVIFLTLSSCLLSNSAEAALSFLGWSDKCNLPQGDQVQRPDEECDFSRGLICQKYTQGSYCGCLIGGQLSYDKQSKECRRKVASFCSYEASDDILNQLSFNQKCHEWAECVQVNLTAATGRKSKDAHICKCREGYLASRDFQECVPIKTSGASSLVSKWTFGPIFILFGLISMFMSMRMSMSMPINFKL